jgi:1,4-dihydroxy-2-naphthoate octaprenyltransferase
MHMQKSTVFKIWASQIRAPFLLLSVMLVGMGGAAAFHDGAFNGIRFVPCMVGIVLAHSAVNLFNEHSDYATGIDNNTRRTPFSGGSGNLPAGRTTPRSVLAVAIALLSTALGIGIFLAAVSSWAVMLFVIAGGLAALLYTSHLSRWGLGEITAGMCLGSLVVIGTYFTLAGTITREVVLLSVPPGILTALLLLLNEFPDVQADRRGGRRHLVILLGWRGAAIVYTLALTLSYAMIVVGAIQRWFPPTVMLACLTLPLSAKAAITALRYGDRFEKMVPALGANVAMILGTDLLVAVGLML